MAISFERETEYYSDWWRVTDGGDAVVLVFAEDGQDTGYALAEKIDRLMNDPEVTR